MARHRALLALLLLLSTSLLPSMAAAPTGFSATALAAEGPDADGAWLLPFDLHADAPARVALALDVAREDAAGDVVSGRRDAGALEVAAGTTRWNATFLPSEGDGNYTVTLLVDETPLAQTRFNVTDGAGAVREVLLQVMDEPTTLELTSDTVNADGKVKAPGDTVITRMVLSDPNGVQDVDAVAWTLDGPDGFVADGRLGWTGAPNATSASLEHRLERSPLAAGTHRLNYTAVRGDAVLANASRTFVARDVAPVLLEGALADVLPDENATQPARVVLGDRNGAPPADLAVEARTYRGSTRAEGRGVVATIVAGDALADDGGHGRREYALSLAVPAGTAAGSYRVSLVLNNTTIGSLPFEVLPLPTLALVDATPDGSTLRLAASGTGDGLVSATLTDGAGATTRAAASFVNGSAQLDLPAPRRDADLRWRVELRAREDGPVLDAREGDWSPMPDGPALEVSLVRGGARLPLVYRVDAPDGWPVADAQARVEVRRWDGAPEPSVTARLEGTQLRLDGPPTLPAGLYHATLGLTWPNGTRSEASWEFEAGPWMRIRLGEPTAAAREAVMPLHNDGGLAVRRLVAEAEPAGARLSLVVNGTEIASREAAGRAVFSGFTLAPGEEAQLVVRLPDGPMRSGEHPVKVRVLAGGR